ncbi:hypothetical protein [Kineococcus radiotolerans]|uniref:Uncharacterized protein n=1 Tax=Kineococcus radiotolerans (strain ATCC BAA-149 / DSM 14245 / SRS30216) TaxID=266940 RepID=A6WA71_KINRD|nr:hypothetical protein [Kineococcus radiotolerans]ABS03710.1 hypothetical protein Krad_2229 [Kineococcus radiotolerans SRS30216 = ATCC BAA-149]
MLDNAPHLAPELALETTLETALTLPAPSLPAGCVPAMPVAPLLVMAVASPATVPGRGEVPRG